MDDSPESGDLNGVGRKDVFDVNPDGREIYGASSAYPETEDENYYTLLGLTVGASPENIKVHLTLFAFSSSPFTPLLQSHLEASGNQLA